jgi:phosphoglycerate dehydrogenase-like enzyme
MKEAGMHKVVFVTERGLRHQQDALAAAPQELAVQMLRQPERETLLAALEEAEFLITERIGLVDAAMIAAAPNLRLIQRLGSLTYDIDTAAAAAAGVVVCYWPVDSVIRVAEHTVLQMLAVGKKLREVERIALTASSEWGESKRTDEDTFAYNWSRRSGVDQLWQRKVGIIGFGEIGAEVARRLRGWGCAILYNKRRRLPETVEIELGLTYVDADALYAESDYLVNLLPYFSSTDMLIGAKQVAKMKRGAFLVSCGSGSVLDEGALASAVEDGRLAGVALDTFEYEPIRADNPLLALARKGANVLLTPHTAAGTAVVGDISSSRAQDYTNIMHNLKGTPYMYRAA